MNHEYSFDLTREGWLQCSDEQGETRLLGLRDLFLHAHELRGVSGDSPPQTVAIHRTLLAMLICIVGRDIDPDKWEQLWEVERFNPVEIEAYFNEQQPNLDLFSEDRPFFQSADSRVKQKSVISLSHDRASGNNATLFAHHTEAMGESLTPAEAARAVITAQAFGLAGLSGIKPGFTDGTCAGGTLFLLEGATLKETLLLNLLEYPDHDIDGLTSGERDAPAWEMPDPFIPERILPFGLLDYLTWQNRRILLFPERDATGATVVRQMTMGPALSFDGNILDPMKFYRPDKKLGHVAISFSESRALWRDSAAILSFHEDSDGHHKPPATLTWVRDLVDEYDIILQSSRAFRLSALGMSKKQAKVLFFRADHMQLPLVYLDDEALVDQLADCLSRAEEIAKALHFSLRIMGIYLRQGSAEDTRWGELPTPAKTEIDDWIKHTGVERLYWSQVGDAFAALLAGIPNEPASVRIAWLATLRVASIAAFDHAFAFTTQDPRAHKAAVRGRGNLFGALNQYAPKLEE